MPGKPVRTRIRDSALRVVRSAGALAGLGGTAWRTRRLLILCYHGFARWDEDRWDPALYVSGPHLESRLRFLLDQGYNVLGLGEGLDRMAEGTLPKRAVAVTVDDGTYDFRAVAYPVFQRLGVPVTVYVTTYYVEHQVPVFDVACGYALWKAWLAGVRAVPGPVDAAPMALSSVEDCPRIARQIRAELRRLDWSAERKQEWLATLVRSAGLDWDEFLSRRMLGLMQPEEIATLDPRVAQVQLHTHRHRVPEDRELFIKELRDNRDALARAGIDPATLVHFCYPSGVYRPKRGPECR